MYQTLNLAKKRAEVTITIQDLMDILKEKFNSIINSVKDEMKSIKDEKSIYYSIENNTIVLAATSNNNGVYLATNSTLNSINFNNIIRTF